MFWRKKCYFKKMEKENKKKNKNTIDINLLFSETKMRLITVFSTNITIIAICALIGYLIDKFFGTWPGALVICIVISFPLSIYAQIKQAKRITDKIKDKHNL